MRQAKTCPACGAHCAAAALDCEKCSYPLDSVDISIVGDAGATAVSPPASPRAAARPVMPCGQACTPSRQRDGTCFDCGHVLGATATPAVRVWINWPWNQRTEIVGSLCIGRAAPSAAELAARLECSFDNISRRHATLTLEGESLSVCDHGSANGTFIDGERVAPHTTVVVKPGASLRFAADLKVDFTWERSGA
jgi:hypothetical protein